MRRIGAIAAATVCVTVGISFTGAARVAAAGRIGVPFASLSLKATDLITDRTDRLVFASTPPDASVDPSSIVAIDADSWSIVNSVAVGGAPGELTISDDDRALYVTFAAEQTVREYELPGLTLVREIAVTETPTVPLSPFDVAVMPGQRDVVAISLHPIISYGATSGVAIFDRGVRRPAVALAGDLGDYRLTFGETGADLYAQGWPDFVRLKVDASGATTLDRTPQLLRSGDRISYQLGMIYGSSGAIVDPSVPAAVGAMATLHQESVVTDATYGRAYALGPDTARIDEAYQLEQWDVPALSQRAPLPLLVSHYRPVGDAVVVDGGALAVAMKPQAVAPSGDGLVLLLEPGLFDGALGEYTPLTPARILDTRDGVGRDGSVGPVLSGQAIKVDITGRGGVPATGVDAVVINATVTNTTAAGYLTISPSGVPRPVISSVNFVAGQTVPNLVTVTLGYDGALDVFNSAGSTDVIFDVAGFYSAGDGPHGERFHPLTPGRLLDTRDGTGGVGPALGPDDELSFKVTGVKGVPATGVRAVVMNVTVTRPTMPGYLTVYPGDVARPVVSNLNFVPGLTVPNLVIVRVPADGVIKFFNSTGVTDVLADVVGYFDDDVSTQAGRLFTFIPFRVLDTRESSPYPGDGKMWPDSMMWFGDPDDQNAAYVMNVTVTEPESAGYLTLFPYHDGAMPPYSSNVNFVAGQTVANAVIVGAGPYIGVHDPQTFTHVVIDVFGFYV